MNNRKKPLHRLLSDIEGHVSIPCDGKDEFKEPETWAIITALDRILDMAEGSQLSDKFWESVKNPLAFLNKKLGLTNIQIVVLAIMIENGDAVSCFLKATASTAPLMSAPSSSCSPSTMM